MYNYEKEVLPNGLRVLYMRMPHIHSVVMAAYIGIGSRYEKDEKLGLSHLLEHMLFRGPRDFKDSLELLQAVDDIGGEIDAYTSPEYSAVLIQVHKKHGKRALEILGGILLGGNFREADLYTEKHIIQEEISEFMDNKGDYICIDDISYNLMWKTGSINSVSFGDKKTIDNITREDLEDHYERFFVAENVVICVSGNFDKEKVRSWIEDAFGEFRGRLVSSKPSLIVEQKAPKCLFKKVSSQATRFKLCHKAYPYKHPNVLTTLLVTDVLGGGISSRLPSNVRERLGLAYEITSYPTLFSDVGSVDIYTSTKKGNFEKTVTAVMDEVNKLVESGISREELRRTEERVYSQMQFIMDSPLAMANWFGTEELLIKPAEPDRPEIQAKKVHRITPEKISRVIKEIFVPERRNMVVVGPTGLWERKRVRKLLE
ncbi:MAG: M16 family metallopeptidase [Candidatus Brocadiales bacterium]